MKGLRRLMIGIGVIPLSLGLSLSPASAKQFDQGHYHDEDSGVINDFCDVTGLTVRFDYVADGVFVGTRRGSDGLVYFTGTEHGSTTLTNVNNGKSLHDEFDGVSRDLSVTDNGDGTLTIVFLETGGDRWYGSGSQFLFTNPGQSRFEIVITDGGTPGDPSDDGEPISFTRVFGSTGRNDPIGCPQFVSYLS
jgi:hypothetical protein